jgi:type IV pilus assembly protein PilM
MAISLSSIVGDLSLFRKKERSVVGIDIGSSSIKVVQLRKKRGAAVLETYGELSLGPYAGVEIGRATQLPPEKLAEALSDIITEANVTTKSAGISIPISASLISLITMPALDESQLKKMVPIEARKYIPVPITEVALDWFVLPEESRRFLEQEESEEEKVGRATKKVEVLLVAIHKEILSLFGTIMQKVGLEPSFFEIEIFSTIRSVIPRSTAPVMIIDLGAATTKLYIVEYGIIRASHIVTKGSQDVTLGLARALNMSVGQAEELKRKEGLEEGGSREAAEAIMLTVDYLFSEVSRVILQYEQRYHRSIGEIFLVGGGALLKGMAVRAEKRFETKVSLGLPFARTESPAFLEEVLLATGPNFSVAVGAALRKLQGG